MAATRFGQSMLQAWAKPQSVDDLAHDVLDNRRGNYGRITRCAVTVVEGGPAQ